MRWTGSERLKGLELGDATVVDFWRWAFGNLRMNDLRGVFAEWLVARLIGEEIARNGSWGEYDLVTPEGVRIEVKAGSYVQDWEQTRPSAIVFGSLKGRTWNPRTGYAATATFNADLYVFCVETMLDQERWDPLDLGQWEFYLVPRAPLERYGARSISLSTIRRMAQPMSAAGFRAAVRDEIAALAAGRRDPAPDSATHSPDA